MKICIVEYRQENKVCGANNVQRGKMRETGPFYCKSINILSEENPRLRPFHKTITTVC